MMKTRRHARLLGAAVIASGWLAAGRQALQAAPPVRKIAILECSPGWRGSAQGQYGGVGFALFCQNGRDRQKIEGFTGTAYSGRMGAESESTGIDCLLAGDASTFSQTCGEGVRISVQNLGGPFEATLDE